MPEEFRSLASALLAARAPAASEPAFDIVEETLAAESGDCEELAQCEDELLRDVRLFHAHLIEAVECARETVMTDIAAGVLARELRLAPADVDGVVDAALQRYFDEEPLRVRVHPAECAAVQCGLPVVADAELLRGDAVIELRAGSIDARLGVRLAYVLRSVAP